MWIRKTTDLEKPLPDSQQGNILSSRINFETYNMGIK